MQPDLSIMKNQYKSNGFNLTIYVLMVLILIVLIFTVLIYSRGRGAVPSELIGRWEANKSKITMRTDERLWNFRFISDSVVCWLEIKNNNAGGATGQAELKYVEGRAYFPIAGMIFKWISQ
jgi:hypothetical protein